MVVLSKQPLKDRQSSDERYDPNSNVSKLLTRIYYNPSKVGSFGGVSLLRGEVDKLLKRANQQLTAPREVETWLSAQPAYVLHKRVRTRQFKRNPMKYAPDVGSLFQA